MYFGAIPSKKDVRNYKAVCAAEEFPAEYELSMPGVKDQGSVGSCVAHALATIVEYYNIKQGACEEEMSVGYIYGNRDNSSHKGKGMYVSNAIHNLLKYGDCHKDMFPYNEEVPTIITKYKEHAAELKNYAYPHRITSYYMTTSDNSIKSALMAGNPVAVCLKWYSDMKVIDGVLHTEQVNTGGYHEVVIYGWNETGWKIQNSWGTDWGNGGRAILPFDIPRKETWSFTDEYTECSMNIKKPFSSKVGKFIAKILNFFINLFGCDK